MAPVSHVQNLTLPTAFKGSKMDTKIKDIVEKESCVKAIDSIYYDHGGGKLEAVEWEVELTKNMVGRILDHLIAKGLMTKDEAFEIIDDCRLGYP